MPSLAPSFVIEPEELSEVSIGQVGSKAFQLVRLSAEFHVPRFFVISPTALQHFVEDHAAPDDILHAEIPADLESAIRRVWNKTFSESAILAVRSSALHEDGNKLSFAGVYESVLGVDSFNSLLSAIRQVWYSAFSPRSRAYIHQMNGGWQPDGMAVIVQAFIPTEKAGVCFTADPTGQESKKVYVNSLWGLGQGLVSGELPADTYTYDRRTRQSHADITEKERLIECEAGQLRAKPVPHEAVSAESLTHKELLRVVEAGLRIEEIFDKPQDVEFGFVGDELYVFQARPITTGAPELESDLRASSSVAPSPSSSRERQVWDNSNIIESYFGVTTPMTFSFIRRAYSIVYRCFSEVMGIPAAAVNRHADAFDNMLGLFKGRVYYNLKNWHRLVRLFPGYRYNSQFMESMMGVKESAILDEKETNVGFFRRWFVEFPSLLKLLMRSGWNFYRLPGKVRRFEKQFTDHYEKWSNIEFDKRSPQEIAGLYLMMERKMLWNWKTPIINDFSVMVFFGVLRKLCAKWCGDESLSNGLVCGEKGLKSDEPAKLLMRMVQEVENDRELKCILLDAKLEDLPEMIRESGRFERFQKLMETFLSEFGLRCADELKLESISYEDEPHQVYQILRSYLEHGAPISGVESIKEREQEVRNEAEAKAESQLKERGGGFVRRSIFRWVLRNARDGIRQRENMRLARTKIYGILRRMLRSIGRSWQAQGDLHCEADIFYLTLDEVWGYIRGTAVTTDLKPLVAIRKAEFERFAMEEGPPDHFETVGLPYRNVPAKSRTKADSAIALTGLACCPGTVEGEVQLIRDPRQPLEFTGGILVAERTDPGWVPLFPAFSGILVERGSILSHSAIVAREMGIPTIVGIRGLTDSVYSGQAVRMNGSTGEVYRLDGDEDGSATSVSTRKSE